MFRPNQRCVVITASKQTDVYGQPVRSFRKAEGCVVVKLNVISAKSAIRADTSASRGNARELEVDMEILLAKSTTAEIDDLIEFAGTTYRIASKFPRFDLLGKLDHYQLTCTYWSA